MSLTKEDLLQIKDIITDSIENQVKPLITEAIRANNLILFEFMLKNFLTKKEAYDVFATKNELKEIKSDISQLKDDVAGLRDDFRTYKVFTDHNFDRHESDIKLLKSELHV